MKLVAAILVVAYGSTAEQPASRQPMAARYEDSAVRRWLDKKVLEARLLDNMENPATWQARGNGEITFTKERAIDGTQSLRMRANAHGDGQHPSRGRAFGSITVKRVVQGEDWTRFNRVSIWVYPTTNGFWGIPFAIMLENDGKVKLPDVYGREGRHYVNLQNRRWNHIVWEITNLPRDKVTSLDFVYAMQGNEPEADPIVTYDLDHLELQVVNPDHYEGWNVTPGLISFSHPGYSPGAAKTALASDLTATTFELVSQQDGSVVLTGPVQQVKSPIGQFQVMDFTEVRTPGTYRIRAGDRQTQPFRIAADVWRDSISKDLNFFYTERCGMEIPGVHRACHRDWLGVYGDKRIIINGGWHDAGDLSQGTVNTSEAVYAMFSLAEKLRMRGTDPDLQRRLIEEAKWGLDWVLKTGSSDGLRIGFAAMSDWTNGVIGDFDDGSAQASNLPYEHLLSCAAEAIAARVLKPTEPDLAAYSLRKAAEDFRYGNAAIGTRETDGGGTSQSRGGSIDLVATGALAALDMWRATGEQMYADRAAELGNSLVDMQQRTFLPEVKIPFAGFFYSGPRRDTILHYEHRSHEQMPVVALTGLSETLPDHKDWMRWYSAVTLYSEYYQKAMARFTRPYGVLPTSIYRDDEYLQASADLRDSYQRQVLKGIEIGKGYYLRLFPVWSSRRGTNGTGLSAAKALSAAAQARGNLELISLAEQQAEWVIGRNPFVQSMMYGEGYDWAPQYSESSGDLVGSLPVGIESREDEDVPYWPPAACYNYKEVWVHPGSRWFFLMGDIAGNALVTGTAKPGFDGKVSFRDSATGQVTEVAPQNSTGIFQTELPAGRYAVSAGGQTHTVTVLPGRTYSVDLRPGHELELTLTKETKAGEVTVRIVAEGSGRHQLTVRADNITFEGVPAELNLIAENPETVVLRGHVSRTDAPWIAVVIPDDDFSHRHELTGTI